MKSAAKALIEYAIYPKEEELKTAVEVYVRANHRDFISGLSNKKWNIYYAKNIHGLVKYIFINI